MFKHFLLAVQTAICVCSLVAISGIEPASAATPRWLQGLPYESIGTYTSQPGESEVAFLERMRPVLRAFSDKTQLEACGAIAATPDGKGWGIVLGSSRSHLGCAIYHDRLPAGMVDTGVTIHSHGGTARFYLNRADKILIGAGVQVGQGQIDTDTPVLVAGQVLDHFSPTDYAGGPGYLATPTGLLYQDGHPGSERVVVATLP